jgi:hypothetical protein
MEETGVRRYWKAARRTDHCGLGQSCSNSKRELEISTSPVERITILHGSAFGMFKRPQDLHWNWVSVFRTYHGTLPHRCTVAYHLSCITLFLLNSNHDCFFAISLLLIGVLISFEFANGFLERKRRTIKGSFPTSSVEKLSTNVHRPFPYSFPF